MKMVALELIRQYVIQFQMTSAICEQPFAEESQPQPERQSQSRLISPKYMKIITLNET